MANKPLATIRVLPMELQIGDRLSDETGEWEVVGQPVYDGRRQDRARPCSTSRPAGHHRAQVLGRPRADQREAGVSDGARHAVVSWQCLHLGPQGLTLPASGPW